MMRRRCAIFSPFFFAIFSCLSQTFCTVRPVLVCPKLTAPHRNTPPPPPPPQSPVSNKTHYGYELYIGAVGKSSWFKSSGPLWIFASRQPDSGLIELLRNFSQHVSGISKRFSAVGVRQSSFDFISIAHAKTHRLI